jgi:hypothetical protein
MPTTDEERRYSEEEFALVLEMASEEPDAPEEEKTRTLAPVREGLTLAQIQEIASEVGIDPDRISRAAALLPHERESGVIRLIGGNPVASIETVVEREASETDLRRIAEAVRREVGVTGKAQEVLGALEWRGNNTTTIVTASATPRDGSTALQVSADSTGALLTIIAAAGLPTLGVVALTLVKLVFGETDAGIVLGLLSGLPPAAVVSRILWKRTTKAWRERLVKIMDAMSQETTKVLTEGTTGHHP